MAMLNNQMVYKTTLTSSFSEHLERKNVGPTIPKPVLLQNEKAFAQGCLPEELFDNNLRLSHTFAVEAYALRTEIAVNRSGRILPASREWIHPWAHDMRRPDDRSVICDAVPRVDLSSQFSQAFACGCTEEDLRSACAASPIGGCGWKAIQRILFWDL